MIKNGSDILLNTNPGTLPNVSGALLNWFQKLTIGIVTKTIQNFILVETVEEKTFQGVWQPMSARKLMMKPEGQRQWKWFTLHCDVSLILQNDDIVTHNGSKFRVMGQTDYSEYGYLEYELSDDYIEA